MGSVVIDASVALKWFLMDEEDRDKAKFLLRQFAEGEVKLVVPTVWLYEIVNSFRSNLVTKKVSKATAKRYIKKLINLEIVTIDFESMLGSAFNLATRFDISIYDAAYLALAKSQNFPFYTADQKLLNKIPTSFKNVYHLSSLETDTN